MGDVTRGSRLLHGEVLSEVWRRAPRVTPWSQARVEWNRRLDEVGRDLELARELLPMTSVQRSMSPAREELHSRFQHRVRRAVLWEQAAADVVLSNAFDGMSVEVQLALRKVVREAQVARREAEYAMRLVAKALELGGEEGQSALRKIESQLAAELARLTSASARARTRCERREREEDLSRDRLAAWFQGREKMAGVQDFLVKGP